MTIMHVFVLCNIISPSTFLAMDVIRFLDDGVWQTIWVPKDLPGLPVPKYHEFPHLHVSRASLTPSACSDHSDSDEEIQNDDEENGGNGQCVSWFNTQLMESNVQFANAVGLSATGPC